MGRTILIILASIFISATTVAIYGYILPKIWFFEGAFSIMMAERKEKSERNNLIDNETD